MAEAVIMPKLGLTMTEGTILNWFKKEGELVRAGEPLFEVETDKVALEVNAAASGTVLKILAEAGTTAPLSEVIAYIGEPGEMVAEDQTPPPVKEEDAIASPPQPEAGVGPAEPLTNGEERLKVSGLARRLAREQGVDISTLQGTGPQGRIVEADILRAIEARKGVGAAPGQPAGPAFAESPFELRLLNSVRKLAARRMSESFQSAPHFYLGVELNVGKLVTLRDNLLVYVDARQGVRITYTDFLLRALALALPGHPLLNAAWDGEQVRVYSQVHLGVAIATDSGLVVGVIHQAERLRLEELARQRAALSDRARAGKLAPDDVAGGTFTLTNLGMYAIDDMIPILNPPQSAILGAGAIVERPVGENGQVVLRPTLRLTLSVDHRVADGADAAQFMKDLRQLLEEPEKLV